MTVAGEVEVRIRAELDRFDRELRGVETRINQFDRNATRSMGNVSRAAGGVVRGFLAIGAAVAGVQGLQGAIRTVADFSQEMSTVRAVTGATADEFNRLQLEARRLGVSTRFSATQAAEGMTFLSRAGFTVAETLEATESTLLLAQAGALGLGEAADIASNVMRGFRLEVDQTNRIVDVLSFTANNANTTVSQLGEAMSFAAPVAAGLGVSLEETAAAIAVLSDAGIQGSRAGTGLTRVFIGLENPTARARDILRELGLTAEDVRVSQVGLSVAMERLAEAGLTTGQALEIFGQRGGPAFEVLADGIVSAQNMNRRLQDVDGTARRTANTMDQNLNGAMLRLRSATEGLIVTLGAEGGEDALATLFDNVAGAIRNVEAAIRSDAAAQMERFNAEMERLQTRGSAANDVLDRTGALLLRISGLDMFTGEAARQRAEAAEVIGNELPFALENFASALRGVFDEQVAFDRLVRRMPVQIMGELDGAVLSLDTSTGAARGSAGMFAQALQSTAAAASEATEEVQNIDASVQNLVRSMQGQIIALRDGELAAALYNAELEKGASLNQQERDAIIASVHALQAQTAARAIGDIVREQEHLAGLVRLTAEEREIESTIFSLQVSLQRELTKEERVRLRIAIQLRQEAEKLAAASQLGAATDKFDPRRPEQALGRLDTSLGGGLAQGARLREIEREAEERRILIDTLRKQEILSAEEHAERLTAIERDASMQRIEARYAEQRMILAASSEGFAALASIARDGLGEQSAAYQALFAVSKAFAIAESIMAIQTAIAKAMALGFPQNIPFMAQAAAQGARIVSTIQSTSLPGFNSGGSMMIGGHGGIDKNILSINGTPAARVGRGERLDIIPANKAGSGSGISINIGTIQAGSDISRQEVYASIESAAERVFVESTRASAQNTQTALRQSLVRPTISARRGRQ